MRDPKPEPASTERDERTIVERQLGRSVRDPWRVAARCRFGYPTVVASPPMLEDGTPFPTLFWLTCPYLAEKAAAAESRGDATRWRKRLHTEPELAEQLDLADAALRQARASEANGSDRCAGVGIAGQRDSLGVKCLHAHVACALAGIQDPIGIALIEEFGDACEDERCRRLEER